MNTYFKLLRFIKPYIPLFIWAIIAMLILALTTAIYSYLVGPLLKFIFVGEDAEKGTLFNFVTLFFPTIKSEPERFIYALPVFLLIIGLFKGISYAVQFYIMGYIGQRVIFDLRRSLFDAILIQDTSFFWDRNSGDLTSRIVSDCEKVEQSVTYALSSAIRDTVQIIVLIGLCFYLDYRLTLISFVALIVAAIPLGLFGLKLKETTIDVHNRLGEIASTSNDYINGIQTVHLYSIHSYARKIFLNRLNDFFRNMKRSLFIRAIQSPVMELIGIIGICLTIIYARERISSGELKPENFISLFATILMMYNPIKNVSRMNNFFTSGIAGAKRIFDIIEKPPAISSPPGGMILHDFRKGIEFESVSMSFQSREILKDIDMTIQRGHKVGIAGESGSGKTTLLLLITRMVEPDSGRIMIDGTDIKDMNLDSLRGIFSVVSQDVILFNDTIFNNILIGRLTASREEVIEASRKANLYEFIMSLPAGFDTEIGERGVRLSGGERQRLSIARAFLKNAPIIILDEATSALDSQNEIFIQRILDDLMSSKTAVIISHRISFLRGCDRIYVLKDKEICEQGSFDELLNKNGIFSTYYKSQTNGEEI